MKKFLSVFFVSCLGVFSVAQEDFSKYKFISLASNRLYFSKDSSAFINLYNKLEQVKSSNNLVSIAHIGGSHVQAGIWSSVFTQQLQDHFKTKGGGYFGFLYKVAKTNGQPYMSSFARGKWHKCRGISKDFCLPLGLSAMNVNTNDSFAHFGAVLKDPSIIRKANVVRVYHNFNASFIFKPTLSSPISFERTDFPKQGYSSFSFNQPLDSVNFELLRVDTLRKNFVLFGISFIDDSQPGFFLAALGANGASSSTYLRCSGFANQFESLSANLVIISLGVNDTQPKGFDKEVYKKHYDSLITIVKKANPGVAILLTTTTDNYVKRKNPNKRAAIAREAMFELMEKHKVGVWDLYTVMGGFKSIAKWYKVGLAARDKVHFTSRGYNIVGKLMYEALMKSYLNYTKN